MSETQHEIGNGMRDRVQWKVFEHTRTRKTKGRPPGTVLLGNGMDLPQSLLLGEESVRGLFSRGQLRLRARPPFFSHFLTHKHTHTHTLSLSSRAVRGGEGKKGALFSSAAEGPSDWTHETCPGCSACGSSWRPARQLHREKTASTHTQAKKIAA